jgi:uncharacterized SAM-binding protein YcdF (DUF218 family)
VLGCRLRPGNLPSGEMRRRVALAVQLHQDGMAPRLVLSGGGLSGASEAEIMRDLACEAGVPAADLLCEAASRNTAENALFSTKLLRDAGWHRIVLVSHRTHLCRARLLFRLVGIEVVACAGVSSRSWPMVLRHALHEAIALPRSVVRVLRRR